MSWCLEKLESEEKNNKRGKWQRLEPSYQLDILGKLIVGTKTLINRNFWELSRVYGPFVKGEERVK